MSFSYFISYFILLTVAIALNGCCFDIIRNNEITVFEHNEEVLKFEEFEVIAHDIEKKLNVYWYYGSDSEFHYIECDKATEILGGSRIGRKIHHDLRRYKVKKIFINFKYLFDFTSWKSKDRVI